MLNVLCRMVAIGRYPGLDSEYNILHHGWAIDNGHVRISIVHVCKYQGCDYKLFDLCRIQYLCA